MKDLSTAEADALSGANLIGERIMVDGEGYTLNTVVGHGRRGVVWRATNGVGVSRALKFATAGDYEDKTPVAELVRASALESYRCVARLERVARITVAGIEVVALISEWVSGQTLQEILKSSQSEVTADLIRSYVFGISDALGALRAHGLCHDDLNFGNVMASSPLPGIKTAEVEFRVIDLGSLKPHEAHNSVKKEGIDDYRWVGFHLAALHNVARQRFDLSPRERAFLTNLQSIIRSLLDTDPLNRLADARSLYDLVERPRGNGVFQRTKRESASHSSISMQTK